MCVKRNKFLILNFIKNLLLSFYIGILNNIFFVRFFELDYMLREVRDWIIFINLFIIMNERKKEGVEGREGNWVRDKLKGNI